ncbi:MAG: MASE1 domain-containing protein, partial [Bacteroidota bacterium]
MKIKLLLKNNHDVKIILVAIIFYASACLGYFLAFSSTTALPIWPPSGIAFALIVLLGRSAWPGITIGALVANLMAYWNNPTLPPQTIIAISSCIAIGNTLEAVTGNFLVKKWIRDDYPFRSAVNAFRFLFVSLLMGLIGAFIGTLGLYTNAVIIQTEVVKTLFSWWAGNVVGILLFAPFILSWSQSHQLKFSAEKALEIGFFLLCTSVIFYLMRIDYFNAPIMRAVPFMILPFLLWLAFRFELIVAVSGVLIVSLLSVYFTVKGIGPFVMAEPYHSIVLLQIFIGVMSISTIALAATVKERMEAQRKLLEFNETLEASVQFRTKALNEEINTRKEAEEKLKRT